MSPEMIELCKRATFAAPFEWVAGMPVVDDSGATGIVVAKGPRWRDAPDWEPNTAAAIGEGLMVWRPGYGLTGLNGWLLDVSQPGGMGHLVALVEEAYGAVVWLEPSRNGWQAKFYDAQKFMVCTISDPRQREMEGYAVMRAKTLVAALEAAP